MEIRRIARVDDVDFEAFLSVYSASFPIFEQRTFEQHLYAFEKLNYNVNCYFEGNELIGFIIHWDFDDHLYIEHLAIHPNYRGKNYGSLLLSRFIEAHSQQVILEIDPIVDEISTKRYRFYKQLGFVMNDYQHTHPAYREGFEDHQLIVLSTERALLPEEYARFFANLKHIVMNRPV